MSILVIGNAAPLALDLASALLARGERVVLLEAPDEAVDAPTGAIPVALDIADDEAMIRLADTMVDEDVTAVVHIALDASGPVFAKRPLRAYRRGLAGLGNLLAAMNEAGVVRLVQATPSSGEPLSGDSLADRVEVASEWMMTDCERAWGLDFAVVRAGTPDDLLAALGASGA